MICDINEIDLNDSLGEEMRSDSIVNENLAELPPEDWWGMAWQISCFSFHSKNVAKISDNKLTCRKCEEQQRVAKPCCSDITRGERFSVKFNERYVDCSVCHSEMIRLPCCDQFQAKMQVSENIWDCNFFVYLHEKHTKILGSNLEKTRPNRQITEKRKTYIYTKKKTT